MPHMRNRNDGVAHPVKSLHQMLGHDSGTLTPCPVERLDDMLPNGNGKKTSKGRQGGIKIAGNVGDQKSKVLLPPVKRPVVLKAKKK